MCVLQCLFPKCVVFNQILCVCLYEYLAVSVVFLGGIGDCCVSFCLLLTLLHLLIKGFEQTIGGTHVGGIVQLPTFELRLNP